jgi:hypothetical protein
MPVYGTPLMLALAVILAFDFSKCRRQTAHTLSDAAYSADQGQHRHRQNDSGGNFDD